MPRVILDWDPKYKRAIIISDFLENIRASISIPNERKELLKRKRQPTYGQADFLSPITATGRFDIGLCFEIQERLTKSDIEYDITVTDPLREQLLQKYSWEDDYELAKLKLPFRPYQASAIKRLVRLGYGTSIVGTAGGKTLIMAGLIDTIREYEMPHTTLVILPASLVKQTHKEFMEYGMHGEISMWDADNELQKTDIIMASAESMKAALVKYRERKPQTAHKWKPKADETYQDYLKEHGKKVKEGKKKWTQRRKLILNLLSDVDSVLIDEVHGLRKDNVINKVLGLFPTRHRFGFTGTLPVGLLDQWNIQGLIGPTTIDISSSKLREMGHIAQVHTIVLKLNYKALPEFKINPNDPTAAYVKESDFLYHNEYRNKIITKIANSFDNNALIMVDKIDHGETLERILKKHTKKKIYFVQGSVDMSDREVIRQLMEKGNDIICIAMSRIFAVGINIKNIHYVMFAQGGKAKVTLIQSIGRGLRLHENKECLIIIDIHDTTHYGDKHFDERKKYYKVEKITYETKEFFE